MQDSPPNRGGFKCAELKLIIGAVLLLGVPVTLAAAQSSVPTVAVSVSGSNVVLDPSGPIGAGPTRFTNDARAEFNLATLRAGVTIDELRQSLSNPRSVKALGQVFLEATVAPGKSVTVDLRPNTTYVGGRGPGQIRSALTSFTTGAPNGAQAPRPDGRIRMVDYGFSGPEDLAPQRPHPGRERRHGTPLRDRVPAATGRVQPAGRPCPPRHERAGPRACGRGRARRRSGADQPGLDQRQRGELPSSWALRDGVLLQRAQQARHVPGLPRALRSRRPLRPLPAPRAPAAAARTACATRRARCRRRPC